VILTDVSIGGALAEARQCAGLTVADVSARTRIREGLIRAIEDDEFDPCGGDFYARGHIRAIAAAVGVDPDRLVGEYDATHPSARPASLEELPSRRPRPRDGGGRRRWLAPLAYLACLVAIGFVALWLTPATHGSSPAVESLGPAAAQIPGLSGSPHPSGQSGAASTPASSAARTGPAVSPGITGSPGITVAPVTVVKPVHAAAYGPGGKSDGDHPQDASLALSGNPATPWRTDWYTTARFGDGQPGTGLLLGLDTTVTAASVTIELGSTPGADLEVRAGTRLSDMPVVASALDAGGSVRLQLTSHPRVRYLLVWFTQLPPDSAGSYQAEVSSVTVYESS
jgi:cytoskeletal protein RodZ